METRPKMCYNYKIEFQSGNTILQARREKMRPFQIYKGLTTGFFAMLMAIIMPIFAEPEPSLPTIEPEAETPAAPVAPQPQPAQPPAAPQPQPEARPDEIVPPEPVAPVVPDIQLPEEKLTEAQKKEKAQYLKQALDTYEEILQNADQQKAKTKVPDPSFYKTPEQKPDPAAQKTKEYAKEALTNYDEILQQAAWQGNSENTWPELTEEQTRQKYEYLNEALRNYEELLAAEEAKQQKAPATPSIQPWQEEKQKWVKKYYDEALQNYEEILRRYEQAPARQPK